MYTHYRSKPRDVEAAPWYPDTPSAAGAVLGIVIAVGEEYEREGDSLHIVHDRGRITLGFGDWLVLDDGRLRGLTGEEFAERYERRDTPSGGRVTNNVTGQTGGSVIQAGNLSGVNLRL